jgi:lipid-A-disaccharide synthase
VGHPLIDTVARLPDRDAARRRLGLAATAPVLLLLPASRPQELRYLLPAMVAAAAELQRRHPALEVLLPAGLEGFEPALRQAVSRAGLRARVIPADQADALKPDLCAAADAAVTKSGTANLELALRGVPQVTGYRVSRPTALVARHLLRFSVPHISPVNLVLAERLVPELLQEAFNPAAIVAALEPLLDPAAAERSRMLVGYGRLRQALGDPGVTQRAASAILDQVQQAHPCA